MLKFNLQFMPLAALLLFKKVYQLMSNLDPRNQLSSKTYTSFNWIFHHWFYRIFYRPLFTQNWCTDVPIIEQHVLWLSLKHCSETDKPIEPKQRGMHQIWKAVVTRICAWEQNDSAWTCPSLWSFPETWAAVMTIHPHTTRSAVTVDTLTGETIHSCTWLLLPCHQICCDKSALNSWEGSSREVKMKASDQML